MESVSWDYKLRKLHDACPFLFIPLSTADHVLKLCAVIGEGSQALNREDLVEPFLESLNLHLDSLLEKEVHRQINILLKVIQSYILIFSIMLQLNAVKARQSED